MTWFDWLLLGFFSLSILATIAIIGQERKPVGRGMAIVLVIVDGLIIAGIVSVR